MKRFLWMLGGLIVLGVGGVTLSRMLATSPSDILSDPGLINPLPACPSSPNCIRVNRRIDRPPSVVFGEARAALDAIGAASIDADEAKRELNAVFQAFVFEDDVAIVIEPSGEGSFLHFRSASRTGHSDFGVNARRAKRFFAALEGHR